MPGPAAVFDPPRTPAPPAAGDPPTERAGGSCQRARATAVSRVRWLAAIGLASVLAAAVQAATLAQPLPGDRGARPSGDGPVDSEGEGEGGRETPGAERVAGQVENALVRDAFDRANRSFRRSRAAETDRERLRWLLDGIERLQSILGEPTFRSDVLYVPAVRGFRGAGAVARELIRDLGADAIGVYRSRYDVQARGRLQQAIEQRDPRQMLEVVLRYPFATPALDAGLLAAGLWWEQGELDQAAAVCRRLMERPDLLERQNAMLLAIASHAYARLGRPYEAAEIAEIAADRYPTARVRLGAEHVPLAALAAENVEAATARQSAARATVGWPRRGGEAGNDGRASEPVHPKRYAWDQQLPNPTRNMQRSYNLDYPEFEFSARAGLSRVFPVADPTTLFVNNRTSVIALDLYDGAPRWTTSQSFNPREQYWFAEIDPYVTFGATLDGEDVFAPLETPLHERLHDAGYRNQLWSQSIVVNAPRRELKRLNRTNGAVVWSVGGSYDERAPFYDRLSFPQPPLVRGDVVYASASRKSEDNAHIFVVALERYALDLDVHEQEEVRAASTRGETRVRPQLRWATKIATGLMETNLFGRMTREPVPSALAQRGNRLYVNTNIGTIAAVDTLAGEPVWTVPYERIPFIAPVAIRPTFRRLTWWDAPPLIYEKLVIVAPMDGMNILALDVDTGRTVWTAGRDTAAHGVSRGEPRVIVGTYGGKLVVAGREHLYRIDLATGRYVGQPLRYGDALPEPVSRTARLAGAPVIVGSRLYLAVDGFRGPGMVEADLEEWGLVDGFVDELGEAPGTLVASGGVLIAANAGQVAVAFDWDEMMGALRQQEASTPRDLWLRLRIATMLLGRGTAERQQSRERFHSTHRALADRDDEEAARLREVARRGMLAWWRVAYDHALTRGDRPAAVTALREARRFALDTAERVELAMLEVSALAGDAPQQTALLRAMREQFPTAPLVGVAGFDGWTVEAYATLLLARTAERSGDPAVAVNEWQWLYELGAANGALIQGGEPIGDRARESIERLLEVHGRPVYAAVEAQAREALRIATARGDAGALFAVAVRFPHSLVGASARLAAARVVLATVRPPDDPELEVASEALQGALSSGALEGADEVLSSLLLALALERRGLYYPARTAYRAALRRHVGARVALVEGEAARLVEDIVREALERAHFRALDGQAPLAALPAGPLAQRNVFEFPAGTTGVRHLIRGDLLGRPGNVYLATNALILCQTVQDSELVWSREDLLNVHAAGIAGGLLVIVESRAVLGLDPSNGDTRWRVAIGAEIVNAQVTQRIATVMVREGRASFDATHRLLLVDIERGVEMGRSDISVQLAGLNRPVVTPTHAIVYRTYPVSLLQGFVLDAPGEAAFTTRIDGKLLHEPIVIDDLHFAIGVLDHDGTSSRIELRRAADGQIVRTIAIEGLLLAERFEPIGEAGLICVVRHRTDEGSRDTVRAYNLATGARSWSHRDLDGAIDIHSRTTPTASYFVHYPTSGGTMVHALDPRTGTHAWTATLLDAAPQHLGDERVVNLLVTANRLVAITARTRVAVVGNSQRILTRPRLILIDRSDGRIVQRLELPDTATYPMTTAIAAARHLLVATRDTLLTLGTAR